MGFHRGLAAFGPSASAAALRTLIEHGLVEPALTIRAAADNVLFDLTSAACQTRARGLTAGDAVRSKCRP